MTKLNLADLKVQSFITSAHTQDVVGGARAAAGAQFIADLGETLDERPCTFPSLEPEGC